MNKIKKILVCVDFSKYSLMTLEYAVDVAKGTQAQLIVFNVINQRDLEKVETVESFLPNDSIDGKKGKPHDSDSAEKLDKYLPYKVIDEEHFKALKKDRLEKLETIIKENFSDDASKMTIKITAGIPFECILDAIETEGVDLVVMANKGRGNISRVLFGSAAEKVFRHSMVPVLSVRDRKIFKRDR